MPPSIIDHGDGRPRCSACGSLVSRTATICGMCHVSFVPRASVPKQPAPKKKGWRSALATAREAVATAVSSTKISVPRSSHESREGLSGEQRLEGYAAVAIAQAEAGLLSGHLGTSGAQSQRVAKEESTEQLVSQAPAEPNTQGGFGSGAVAYGSSAEAITAPVQAPDPSSVIGAADDGYWECPRCAVELSLYTIDGVHLHYCTRCGGAMVEARSLMVANETNAVWPTLRRSADQLDSLASSPVQSGGVAYLNCPRCSGPMARNNFERVSGVMTQTCISCGTWFEHLGLSRAMAFLEANGRDRRARFEAQEAEHIRSVRKRIEVLDRRARSSRRHGVARYF